MVVVSRRRGKLQLSGDIVFDWAVNAILFMIVIITLYPIIYVFSVSISSSSAVSAKQVYFWPVGFSVASYKLLALHPFLARSYLNTLFYTVVGTSYSLILTIFGAYALSRKNLIGRNLMMFLIFFTMLFGGGMIPTFLVVNQLGLYNTYGAIILPCAVSAYNLIVMRTFMQQIPDSLEESAKIDGANDIVVLFSIYLPMSVPVIATIALFYAVGRWNDWFNAVLYLRDTTLYPLMLVIRNMLVTMTDALVSQKGLQGQNGAANYTPTGFKCAAVIVTIVPIIAVYPFLQRYFIKGVMIGAIKG